MSRKLRHNKSSEEPDGSGRKPRPQTHPVRYEASRQTARRRRDRRAGRDLEAQHPVSARRLPLLLLRHDGCGRRQPLPAGAGLSQGQARAGRLCRLRHGDLRARARQILAGQSRPVGASAARRRCSTCWRTSRSSPACVGSASKFGVPAGRRRGDPAAGIVQLRHRRCGVPAGAAAREQDAGGDRIPARVIRARRRFDAGDVQAVQARA